MKRIVFLLALLLCVALPTYAYTIDGDKITYEGVRGKVTQEPHTLNDLSNEIEITFTSYFATPQTLDIAFGFELPNAKPTQALYYNPITEYIQHSYTCEGYANYTTDPKHMYCYKVNSNTTQLELFYDHYFDSGDVPTKTIYWSEEIQVDYTDISNKFSKINYDFNGKNTWYLIESIDFNPDETKTLKLNVDVLPNAKGKYDILIKRSSDNFQEAYQSGNYILLDPWYDNNYQYCRNLTIETFGIDNVVYKNITGLRLTNSYEARIVNASCANDGTAQNFTVKTSYVAGSDDDWLDTEFLSPNSNTTWAIYYGYAGASDPSYLFRLFTPDFDSCDFTNDWYSEDQAKYSCHGFLNTTVIDSGAYATDQIQTTNSYLAYDKITVYNTHYVTSASGNEWYSRFLAGTTTKGAWDNYWNVLLTASTNNYRVYKINPADDTDTSVSMINQENISLKLHYDPTAETTSLWSYNSTGSEMYNTNDTGVDDVGYWGTWVDETSQSSDIWFYEWAIYLGFVNPSPVNNPTVAIGNEEESPVSPPLWSSNTSTTPATYDASTSTFNITWANGSASNIVETSLVNITHNFTGSNTTETMNLISGNGVSGVYGHQELIGAGYYFWYSNASTNDTATNTTDTWTFTVNQYSTSCWLNTTVTPPVNDSSIVFPNPITAYGGCDNPEGDYGLWRNDTNISTLNNTPNIWEVGYMFFKTNVSATQNYTFAQSFQAVYVTQGNLTNSSYLNVTFNTSNPVTQYSAVNVTCNYPVGIDQTEFKLYNDTAEIGNTTATFNASTLGTMNFTCNSTGNTNWTSGEATNSLTVSTLGGILINAVYDENTLTPLTFNLTIYNDTHSVLVNDITTYNNNTITGDMTIAISKIGYVARDYYADIPDNETYNLTGYLLQTGDGSYITYWAYSSTSPTGELDALVNVTRFVGSGWVSVEQSLSDFEGKGTLFLSPYAVYRVNASKSGVGYVYISSYSANPSVLLRLNIGGTGNATSISWLFTDVNYSLTPTNAYIRNSSDNLTLLNYTIAVGDADLEYYGMNITLADGTNIYSNNTTGASGGTITVNFNMTGREGQTINVRTWFKKENYDMWIWDRGYIVVENHSFIPELFGAFLEGGTAGLSSMAGQLIALLLSIASAGMGKKITSAGSSILFLLGLAVFTFIGFFNWSIFLLLGFVGLIIITGDKWR